MAKFRDLARGSKARKPATLPLLDAVLPLVTTFKELVKNYGGLIGVAAGVGVAAALGLGGAEGVAAVAAVYGPRLFGALFDGAAGGWSSTWLAWLATTGAGLFNTNTNPQVAGIDPLAERVRIINFWRGCAVTNRHYLPTFGAWWHPFVHQPGLRRLLMPKLRARIEAQIRERQAQHAAEMRESAQRWARLKAERAAAKAGRSPYRGAS